jgi:hypothetical protein
MEAVAPQTTYPQVEVYLAGRINLAYPGADFAQNYYKLYKKFQNYQVNP